MRFGGHQTFAIRDGWLYKGLKLTKESPELFADPDLADWLGVGKNMAKAIHHWLLATGLAEPAIDAASKKILQPTALGDLIWDKDRYFLHPGTWWAIHVQLNHHPEHAYSWDWFFNHFNPIRFERPICIEALRRYLTSNSERVPSPRTLDRDVNCLLRSYAIRVPREETDPEEFLECPLSELGILLHSPQTGFFHLNRDLKPIPFEIFAYALTHALEHSETVKEASARDLSLNELTNGTNMPGRIFSLSSEATYELVASYESMGYLNLSGQAGERIVRIRTKPSLEWLRKYYEERTLTEEEAA